MTGGGVSPTGIGWDTSSVAGLVIMLVVLVVVICALPLLIKVMALAQDKGQPADTGRRPPQQAEPEARLVAGRNRWQAASAAAQLDAESTPLWTYRMIADTLPADVRAAIEEGTRCHPVTADDTPRATPVAPTDDRTELRQTVTLLQYAVVFFDVAWCLLMFALMYSGESVFWTLPVAVVAFLVAQGLVAVTWRTPPWKRRAQ